MMKHTGLHLGAAVLALAAGCSGAAAAPEVSGEAAQETQKNTVMVVPYGTESYLMVDQDNGAVFTIHMPEEIYDAAGDRITAQQLRGGNILEIYGDGLMLESYPGQYPGVTKIKVARQGEPGDADRYQSLADELYQEPDPADPPRLNAEFTTSLAAQAALIPRGSYEWSFTEEDGLTQSIVACGTHVLGWQEYNELALEGTTELTLRFHPQAPAKVTVTRWPEALRSTEGFTETQGETVPVQLEDGKYTIQAQPGYVYAVSGVWEQGRAEYGFLTK